MIYLFALETHVTFKARETILSLKMKEITKVYRLELSDSSCITEEHLVHYSKIVQNSNFREQKEQYYAGASHGSQRMTSAHGVTGTVQQWHLVAKAQFT